MTTSASEQADTLLNGLVLSDGITLRQNRLTRLAQAKAVLEARAKEREAAEQAAYEAKVCH